MQVTLPKVIVLLKDTIAAKERHLATLRSDMVFGATVSDTVTEKFLEVNINEPKRILADLEKVQP